MGGAELIILLMAGAVAGWAAGHIMKGRGFGLFGNIIVGVIGAWLGTLLFQELRITVGGDVIGLVATAIIGAVVLLFVIGLIKKV